MSLLQLYPDPSLPPQERGFVVEKVDIIVVHGLTSSLVPIGQAALKAFAGVTADGEEVNWLQDPRFLPRIIPHSRILLYCYDAPSLFAAFSRPRLQQESESLLRVLAESRKDDPRRPTIFLCQSLGGLLIKEALGSTTDNPLHVGIKTATHGIVFFGTPHHGITYREIAKEFSVESTVNTVLRKLFNQCKYETRYLPIPELSTTPSKHLVSESQRGLNLALSPELHNIPVVSFYETIGSVVSRREAILGHPREVVAPLQADHRDLCRFTSVEDISFLKVRDTLQSLVDQVLWSNTDHRDLDYSGALLLHRLSSATTVLTTSTSSTAPDNLTLSSLNNTFQWILAHPSFRRWGSIREDSVLWIEGKPGVGKTTLLRKVVEALRESSSFINFDLLGDDEDTANASADRTPIVAFFFCTYLEQHDSAIPILSSLLHQVLAARPSLSKHIAPDDKLECAQETAKASLLGSVLAAVAELHTVYFVVDGLDECDASVQKDLVYALRPRSQDATSNPRPDELNTRPRTSFRKVLFTRRSGSSIQKLSEEDVIIDLSEGEAAKAVALDVRQFVRFNLATNWALAQLYLELQEERRGFEDSILFHSNGVFLWVNLVLDYLRGVSRDAGNVSSALSSLPRNLDSLYKRMFEELRREEQNATRSGMLLLRWIMFVKRSLSPSEAGEAIRAELGVIRKDLVREIMIGSWAGNFIRIDGKTVSFIHQSAHDFLSAQFEPWSPKVDGRLEDNGSDPSVTTLTYLVQDFGYLHALPLEDRQSLSREITKPTTIETLNQRFPFLEYASVHWIYHVNDLRSRPSHQWELEIGRLKRRLLDPKSAYFQIWFPIFWLHHCKETWERERYPMHPTELVVLAFVGFGRELQWHLETNIENVDEATPTGAEWTPLMAAAWMGHETIVDILLDFDAAAKSPMRHNIQALLDSIERGHITIARKLMRRVASLQTVTDSERSIPDGSLQQEMDRRILLAVRIYVGLNQLEYLYERRRRIGSPALLHLYSTPFLDSVARTLYHDRELTLPWSSLSAAFSLSALQRTCSPMDAVTDLFPYLWIYAPARVGNTSFVRPLLEKGVDVNARDPYSGATPLHLASFSGSSAAVSDLLSHGADAVLPDHFGHSAMDIAIRENRTASFWKLLYDSAKRSATDANVGNLYSAALRLAIQSAHQDIIEILLDELPPSKWKILISSYTFDIFKLQDVDSPFRMHHSDEYVATLSLLFKRGLDPYVKDERQNTLLHHSVRRQWPQLVDSCLQNMTRGIEDRDEIGETALDISARLGDAIICEMLVKRGAQVLPGTYRNSLRSGNPEMISYVRKVRHDQLCACQQGTEPAPPNAQGRSRGWEYLDNRCPVHPMDFIDGKLQKPAEFLLSIQVDDLTKVELTEDNPFPFTNKFKSWLEDTTNTPWIWWPLSPRMHALKPGEVRLHWIARGGSQQQQMISSDLAQDIEQLLDCRDAVIAADPDDECDNLSAKPSCHLSSPGDMTDGVCDHPYHISASDPCLGTIPIRNRQSWWRRIQGYFLYPLGRMILTLIFGAPVERSNFALNGSSTGFPRGKETTNSQPPRAGSSPSGRPPRKGGKRSRKNRRHKEAPLHAPLRHGSYVIFMFAEQWRHIDTVEYSTDYKFFAELKKMYWSGKWALAKWFSIWRYHHCNFDLFKRCRSNLITSKSTGSCTSNYVPVEAYKDQYLPLNNTYEGDEGYMRVAPIDQRQFRALFYACVTPCSASFRAFHDCRAPSARHSPSNPNQASSSDELLKKIPRRKEPWNMREDSVGYAWGLTAFDLPSFAGFLAYMTLSLVLPFVFWGLWLSIWNHEADLQNASVPTVVVLGLWTWVGQWSNGKWNRNVEIE